MLLGEPSGEELLRGRADPDLAPGSLAADSRRQVHRIANGRVLRPAERANVAYHRLSRVDANAEANSRQRNVRLGQTAQLLHRGEGRAAGLEAVVRALLGRIPYGNDSVAAELVYHAPMGHHLTDDDAKTAVQLGR